MNGHRMPSSQKTDFLDAVRTDVKTREMSFILSMCCAKPARSNRVVPQAPPLTPWEIEQKKHKELFVEALQMTRRAEEIMRTSPEHDAELQALLLRKQAMEAEHGYVAKNCFVLAGLFVLGR